MVMNIAGTNSDELQLTYNDSGYVYVNIYVRVLKKNGQRFLKHKKMPRKMLT